MTPVQPDDINNYITKVHFYVGYQRDNTLCPLIDFAIENISIVVIDHNTQDIMKGVNNNNNALLHPKPLLLTLEEDIIGIPLCPTLRGVPLHPDSSLSSPRAQLVTPLHTRDSSIQYLGVGLQMTPAIQASPPSHMYVGHFLAVKKKNTVRVGKFCSVP